MNNTSSLLVKIRPRAFTLWRALPIFEPLLDDFLRWLQDQKYAEGTIRNFLKALPKVVHWLRRRRITQLDQLTLPDLQKAHDYYRPKQADASWTLGALERFLQERHLISAGTVPPPSPAEEKVTDFKAYLRETRRLTQTTIQSHAGLLRGFLKFLRFDRDSGCLQRLHARQIEAFLRQSARTNNRFSLQHIVATLRAFLRWQHAQGWLARPWHLQIDTPRVYRGEQLPRALPWDQIRALIQSIDVSDAFGRRDFTLLYLAAAYGLRSSELVHLSLDDIDWQGRTLRVAQSKTRQALPLPLTDEAANVLIDYLRKARPETSRRELFLRMRAPFIPLHPASGRMCSGIALPPDSCIKA